MRVEKFCFIINRIVSTCKGNVLRMIMKKHLFDVRVEQIKKYLFLKNRAISIYKLSRTEYKKLAHFLNGVSVLGRILEQRKKIGPFLERGINFRGNFV